MKLSPFKPINPQGIPFYYGWLLVPLAVVGVLMSLPGQTAGFSAFIEPLLVVTGFSRTLLSLLYMIGTVVSGMLLPAMGGLLDAWGSRKMMMFASIMMGVTLFFLSNLTAIVEALSWIPPLYTHIVLLTLGIFSLRFFGQGLLTMTANTMVGKWFDKKRGRAIAILGVVNTFAFSATPAVMAALVAAMGWSGAWLVLASIVGFGMTATAYIFYRDTPESCGLLVDGGVALHHAHESMRSSALSGLSRGEAVSTKALWAIVLVLATSALGMTGITFHIQAIGMQSGMSIEQAVAIFIPISFIAIPTSFLSAMLTERIKANYLVAFMAASQLLGFLSIYFLDTSAGYLLTILGLGLASGLMGTMQSAVVPKVFGRLHLGSINGLVTSLTVIMSALGPLFLSAVNDVTGSLKTGVTIMSVLPVIALVLSFRMRDTFVGH